MKFNGLDDFIEIPGSEDFRWREYTITVWVKPKSFTHGAGQIAVLVATVAPDYNCGGTAFHLDRDTFGIGYHPEGGRPTFAMTDSIFTRADDNTWHFLAVRYAHDGGVARIALFRDGQLAKRFERPEPLLAYHGQMMHVGTLYGGASAGFGMSYKREFEGWMDELRVYAGALDDETIRAVYDSGKPHFQ